MTNRLHPTTNTQPKYTFIGMLKDYTLNDAVSLKLEWNMEMSTKGQGDRFRNRDSSAGTETGYGLGGRGSSPG
jgi:hypothetical protein